MSRKEDAQDGKMADASSALLRAVPFSMSDRIQRLKPCSISCPGLSGYTFYDKMWPSASCEEKHNSCCSTARFPFPALAPTRVMVTTRASKRRMTSCTTDWVRSHLLFKGLCGTESGRWNWYVLPRFEVLPGHPRSDSRMQADRDLAPISWLLANDRPDRLDLDL